VAIIRKTIWTPRYRSIRKDSVDTFPGSRGHVSERTGGGGRRRLKGGLSDGTDQ